MPKWTTIRLSDETADAIRLLAEKWQISAGQVVERLLQLYTQYLESDELARQTVATWESEATQASEDKGEGTAVEATAQSIDEQVRDAVSDLLYLTDAVIEVLFTITSVYPDLRAECGPLLDRVARRFSEVAQAWGVWQQETAVEETTEEAEGQEEQSSDTWQEGTQLDANENA